MIKHRKSIYLFIFYMSIVRNLTKSLCSWFSTSTTPHGYKRPLTFLPRTSIDWHEPTTANGIDSLIICIKYQISLFFLFYYFKLWRQHLLLAERFAFWIHHPRPNHTRVFYIFECCSRRALLESEEKKIETFLNITSKLNEKCIFYCWL